MMRLVATCSTPAGRAQVAGQNALAANARAAPEPLAAIGRAEPTASCMHKGRCAHRLRNHQRQLAQDQPPPRELRCHYPLPRWIAAAGTPVRMRAQQAGGATATVSAAARWRCQGAAARPPATPDDKFATTSSRRAPRTQQAAAARRFGSRDGAAGGRVSQMSSRCARACRGTRAGARTGVEATVGGGAEGVEFPHKFCRLPFTWMVGGSPTHVDF